MMYHCGHMLNVCCWVAFTKRLGEDVRRERHLICVLRCVLNRAEYVKPSDRYDLEDVTWSKEY